MVETEESIFPFASSINSDKVINIPTKFDSFSFILTGINKLSTTGSIFPNS